MDKSQQFKIVGQIEMKGQRSPKQAEQIFNALQEFMNQHKIVRLDIALDPFEQGPIEVKPNGTIISTQN